MDQNTLMGLMALRDAFGGLSAAGGGNPGPQNALPQILKMKQEQERFNKAREAYAQAGQGGGLPAGFDTPAMQAFAAQNPRQALSLAAQASLPAPVAKAPASVQEYQFAQGQGFQGSYTDWVRAKAEAGSTRINNSVGGLGKAPTGYAWDNTDPANPALKPIAGGPADKEVATTEGERANAGFRQRMAKAETILRENYDNGYVAPSWFTRNALAAGVDEGYVMSQQDRLVLQAQRDWVRAKLRKESGAVIGDEEMAEEIRTYFPIHGDGEDVISQKRASREAADEQMRIGSGRVPGAGAPSPAAAPPGPRKTLNGVTYEQRNGIWGIVQ